MRKKVLKDEHVACEIGRAVMYYFGDALEDEHAEINGGDLVEVVCASHERAVKEGETADE